MTHRITIDLDQMVTPEEMAAALKMRVRWVREKLLRTGAIPAVFVSRNVIRVRRQDWEIFLANRTKG